MATRRQQRPRRQRPASRVWAVVLVVVLALAGAAAVLLLGQPSGPGAEVAGRDNVKGDPSAPVEVEEWGDFQ